MIFKKLQLKILVLFFSILLTQSVSGEEKNDQPNSLSKQYRDWVYRCVNVNKKINAKLFKH